MDRTHTQQNGSDMPPARQKIGLEQLALAAMSITDDLSEGKARCKRLGR